MTKTKWHVSVSGKWGGGRSITVLATTDKKAREAARSLMRSDESIRHVYNTRETT
jgi:hypothetical protein